eukprot:190093-Pleurochrysis_carterae.AAC.1
MRALLFWRAGLAFEPVRLAIGDDLRDDVRREESDRLREEGDREEAEGTSATVRAIEDYVRVAQHFDSEQSVEAIFKGAF